MTAESLASIATRTGIDVVALIKAAADLKYPSWINPDQTERIIDHVANTYLLSEKEMRRLEDFLLNNPKARSLFSRYAGLEPLITKEEGDRLVEAISKRLVRDADLPSGKKIHPIYLSRIVMNLGVLDVYRTRGGANDVEDFVGECVAPYAPDLAATILTRYFLNKMQSRTMDGAKGFVDSLKEKYSSAHSSNSSNSSNSSDRGGSHGQS